MDKELTAISLFTGAGGMDTGFAKAGFKILWANDFDPVACKSYAQNHSSPIVCGDINALIPELGKYKGVDLVFGGPPCQGFSVAGKMDPSDPRSSLIWSFLEAVEKTKPRAFVCENVKALGVLEKWSSVRQEFMRRAEKLGYGCTYAVLNASDYGAPQSRERVFFIGLRGKAGIDAKQFLNAYRRKGSTVVDAIRGLGRAGSETNLRVCNAKITLAENPVLRKSPYAGMLFNGLGRPLRINGVSATLPASMGGNKTPIIDEGQLFDGLPSWIEEYHGNLMKGGKASYGLAPSRLRRMTVDEAIRIQTFPKDYKFVGGPSAIFRQIGNSVPPVLAECVAEAVRDLLQKKAKRSAPEVGQQHLLTEV